jgi:hypothetical protein
VLAGTCGQAKVMERCHKRGIVRELQACKGWQPHDHIFDWI